MTLYDFIKMEDSDFDTYDTVFDICVTVCVPYESDEPEWYDKFYDFICRKVEVQKKINKCVAVCEWTKFIADNLDVFKEIAREMWREETIPDDDDIDEWEYSWIGEIHGWLAGGVSESEYQKFMEKYSSRIV